jgi:hypothetical protein
LTSVIQRAGNEFRLSQKRQPSLEETTWVEKDKLTSLCVFHLSREYWQIKECIWSFTCV